MVSGIGAVKILALPRGGLTHAKICMVWHCLVYWVFESFHDASLFISCP